LQGAVIEVVEPSLSHKQGIAAPRLSLEVRKLAFTLQRMLASKLMTRLEFRRDMSDQDVFPYRTGLFRDSQNTVTLGMVYAFSSADAK
jgi:hypothetical protein